MNDNTIKTGLSKAAERTFILECIETYKSLPELWNIRYKDYNNRQKKNDAYEVLLRKYKKHFPDATRQDVTKKFNSLRTNYRKELRKFNESKRSDVEAPTLWYFKEMNFLENLDVLQHSNIITGEVKQENVSSTVNLENLLPIRSERTDDIPTPNKKVKSVHNVTNLGCDHLEGRENEYDTIAKSWIVELKKLSPEQQMHAKKAINDILYEGQLGNLYRNCVQIIPLSVTLTRAPMSCLRSTAT